MKRKLIFVSFVITTLFVNIVSPVLAALQPIPAPFANFDQRLRYQTNLFSGSGTYSYPIKVPKGTDDLTPEISLSYNSAAAYSSNAVFGIGWDADRDYIERDVNFTPGSTGDDKFRLYFKGGAHELVYVSSEGRYHTKTESNLSITKTTSGAANEYGEYWQVITPDGTKYRFGQASNSEQVCNERLYVYRWNLDLVTDMHNNNIYYSYSESSGASYLSKIEYNTEKARVIEYTYVASPYQRPVFVQGCNVTESQQLSNIKVKANTNLINQFDLAYAMASNSGQLLQSITEKGTSGSSLPATVFEYKPEVKNFATTPETWINNAPVDVNLTKADVVQVDVTGDGLIDIVKSEGNGSNTWKVWRNTGSGWDTTHEVWVNNQPIDAKLDRTDTKLVDITGDTLPDIIKMHNDGGNLTYKVWRNTGSSWSTSTEVWINSHSSFANITDPSVAIMDVNGDGLADFIKSRNDSSGSVWEVALNTGSTWGSFQTWIDTTTMWGNLSSNSNRLIDVSGDGLPDIVISYGDQWYVWKNTGSS